MLSTVTSFLFFVGVLAFLADLGVGATTTTAPDSSPDWLQESAVVMHLNNATTMGSGPEQCNMCVQVTNKPASKDPSSVEIIKNCGRRVTKFHLNCSQFSFAKLIPETIFKRIGNANNQCLVKNGHHFASSHMIPFRYHNSFLYGLRLSSCDMRSQVQAMSHDDGHFQKDILLAAGAGFGIWYFVKKR